MGLASDFTLKPCYRPLPCPGLLKNLGDILTRSAFGETGGNREFKANPYAPASLNLALDLS
jgi:hypothetical protein